jgi:hypothetical protein
MGKGKVEFLEFTDCNMDAFPSWCPIPVSELKQRNRKHEIVMLRNVAIAGYCMAGETLEKACGRFNLDHSTGSHILRKIRENEKYFTSFLLEFLIYQKTYPPRLTRLKSKRWKLLISKTKVK